MGDPDAGSTSTSARRRPARRRRGARQPRRVPTPSVVRPSPGEPARLCARAVRPHGRVLAAGRGPASVVSRDTHVPAAQERRLRALR